MSRLVRPARARTAALACTAFAALCGAPAGASAAWRQDAGHEVERLLAEPSEAQELARRLAALGPAAAAPLLRALGGSAEREPLGAALRDSALEALELLPRSAVLEALDAHVGPEASRALRCAALEVVGRTGQRSEVAWLARFAAPPEACAERELDVECAFEAAVANWLARNLESADLLAAELPDVPPSLWLALSRALGAALAPARMESLAGLLGRAPGADGLILAEIERLAALAPSAVQRQVRPAVRPLLDDEDPLVCIAACRSVRALEDPEAVAALIRLLDAEEDAVRGAALDTLRALTRQPFAGEQEVWSAWYSAELGWWQGAAQRHLTALRMGLKLEIAPALLGLARGVLFREEIAPALFAFLHHADRDVARLAASVLGSLGSRLAIPDLAEVLASRDPAVASAARKALRQIAGRDLGSAPDDWLALPY